MKGTRVEREKRVPCCVLRAEVSRTRIPVKAGLARSSGLHSIAVRREAYECLGGFDARLKCSEDWEMWVRIAARYPIWHEPAPLAY